MPDLILLDSESSTRKSVWDKENPSTKIGELLLCRKLSVALTKNPTEKVGSIEYDPYDQKYVVWSRLICNEKFGRWNSENKSQRSKHINKMVKVAQTTLLPKQMKEVYSESKDQFLRNISYIRDSANEGMRNSVNNIGMNTWRKELMHMVEVGYKPSSEQVKSAMEYVVKTKDEYEYLSTYDPPKVFVWIKPDGVTYQRFLKHASPDGEQIEVPNTDALPDELKSKLFVLSVCDPKKFVEEVGMKEADDKFWVIV
jgi:hypothetical protein